MNIYAKKIFAVLTCFCLILCLCSCQSKTQTASQPKVFDVNTSKLFRLPYDYSDTLNAYSMKSTTNKYLTTLVYDGLLRTDKTGKAEKNLADTFASGDMSITVTLKEQTLFSDGSEVNASDIVYSYNCAKNSDKYSQDLAPFTGTEIKDDYTVVFFTEEKSEENICALNFPIVKSGDDSIGTGRFYLAENKDGIPLLAYNNYRHDKKKPEIELIKLVNCSDESAMVNMYNADELDFFCDTLEHGSKKDVKGTASECRLDNLMYLGFNNNNKYLADTNFSSAVAAGIDQTSLCNDTYLGLGTPTSTPYPADRYNMGSVIVNKTVSDITATKNFFEKAGYKYNKLGVNLLDGKKQVKLNLLVSSDNLLKISVAQAIKVQFANMGIKVNVITLASEEFLNRIKTEKFDMYLGEVRLTRNYNLDCFFEEGGTSYGINSDCNTCLAYERYKGGNSTLQNFISNFCEENPFVPILYRHGLIYHSDKVKGDFSCTQEDIFKNILEWTYTDDEVK